MVWSVERAAAWYAAQGDWKQGVNYIPSYAVNQIQMWQDYDGDRITQELQWAAALKYNALRVFLHDQLYTAHGDDFLDQVDDFLDLAHGLGFQTILVLLEGIWDPHPQYVVGESQPPPRPFVHNSRWVQSPGADVLANDTALDMLTRPYVQAVIQRFGNDTQRVLMLDLMDQPDNFNLLSYGAVGERVPAAEDAYDTEWEPDVKLELIQRFMPQLLEWVETADPYRQVPVTLADWYNGNSGEIPTLASAQEDLRQLYLNSSDIITFHYYKADAKAKLAALQSQFPGRPIVLASFLARDDGSTLDPILGDMYRANVWALHWGLVNGAIQTIWNSDSWNERYVDLPDLWHHDILWPNGTIYRTSEQAYLVSFRHLIDNEGTGGGTTTAATSPVDNLPTTTTEIITTTSVGGARIDPTPELPMVSTTPATTNVSSEFDDTNQTLAPSRKPASDPKENAPSNSFSPDSWLKDSATAPMWVTLTALGGLLLCLVLSFYCCRRRYCTRRQRRIPAFEVCEQDGEDDDML
eukprot:scaffold4060_cov190-Amphora_coffeaeformis.AAC.3